MLADLPIGEPVPCRVGSLEEDLDLHDALVPNPVCTFYMRVSGNGLWQQGIHDGDLMVIDRSVEPRSGNVVVLAYQGSFLLRPEVEAIPLDLERFDRSGLFGVVVHAVHHPNKKQLRKI